MHKSSNRRKPRIAILVDNPYRDLPGLVLVTWHLCQNGATCYLIPMNLREKEVWPLAPDFVLLNHFRTIYEKFVENMMAAGILVGVLDTEGSIYSQVPTTATTDNSPANHSSRDRQEIMPAMEEYAISMTRDSALRHNVSCFCAWTPAFAEYARQSGWYSSEQITVTGAPRMDFYAPQWHHAARRMSPYVDTYPEPIILINSNFTIANSLFLSPEKEIEWMVNKFAYSREFVEKWRQTQETAIKLLSSLANKLAKHFPEVTFIYRPHPFEGEEIYKTLLEPLPNLHLVKKGTVDGWLLRAKALIHWGSSTAIDACLVGVPAFTAGWIPAHLPVPSVDSVSIKCSTEKELLKHIDEVLNGNFKLPPEIAGNIKKVVAENFYKIDGYAHKRVADAILKAVYSRTPNPSLSKCSNLVYGVVDKSLIGRATRSIRKGLSLSPHWSFRQWKNITGELAWDHSEKYFDAEQVKSMMDAIVAGVHAASEEPRLRVGVQPA